MDPLDAVLDEVALEGLDGISIQTLWFRLRTRQPEFGLNLDPLSQQFIWSCLIRSEEIRFYLLPENRRTVSLHDRFVEVDRNTGIHEMRQAEAQDVYPVCVLTDDPGGLQGSCVFFSERLDVSEEIRAPLTLEEVQARWGERLVMVASAELRYRALIGPEGNPELKLPDLCYCILERLGRARWQGELQRDLHTRIFRMDAGKMHYLRRTLDRNGLITLQSHVARLPSGAQQHSLLLLLRRFHVDRRSKYDILMESTSNILSDLPDKTGVMMKIREQLRVCERTFKRVYQYMTAAKMVTLVKIPLKELDPTGGPFKTLRGTDVFVRCLKLLKPYGQKEVEEEEDDENNDEEGEASVKRNVLAEPRFIERDVLTQAYDIVVSTGTRGISQSVLRARLNVGKLEGRMICRLLERINMIKGFMEDEGRQRTTKYISKLFVEQSKLSLQFTKERQRSQHLRVTHLTEPEPEPEPEPDPTAGVSEDEEGAKDTRPKLKQAKLNFSKKATPLKKKPSARVGGAKASQKAVVGQNAEDADHASSTSASQSEHAEEPLPVIVEVLTETKKVEIHETYRLLKRKNMIIEAVRCSKIIEGFYSLQKLLTEEERKDGVSTKVCKKSVVRLIRSLSREGLLKLYRTIVIQDGVQKKVEFVVHPSVTPDDPLVKSAIEQIRMRMSSSASAARVESQAEKVKSSAQEKKENKASHTRSSHSSGSKKVSEKMGVTTLKSFRPVLVPGLGRSLGFQPKMPRLRIVHSFLWFLIYGHPIRRSNPADPLPDPETDPETEGFRVFVKENTWKRFIPPIPLHKDFGFGWALISDVLVSLPLSVFMQVVQVNYQIAGLEEYLNDPVKKHYLIRFLPADIKRQLLHRRKYIFSFHESLQRLCFMGLLQFGPTEKFMDKDQVFVFLKTKAKIVDTTVCDPHYNMAIETMRAFERRHYVFSSAQDVENYWFDLLCVCLNTPLGVIRPRPGDSNAEGAESDVAMTMERNTRLLCTLQGSCDVVDDGVTPGDGQGAGGLDSCFFSHLKRNWTWTSHLINQNKQSTEDTGTHHTVRLRNLLSKHPPPKPATLTGAQSGAKVAPPAVLEEEVRLSSQPASRNQEVCGGRNLKRKRPKTDSSKPARKKKKVRVRRQSQAQDETDQRALLQMTRQRVAWTHMEDSLLMLCRVASHFLNRKLKRPFVPWTVVRDVLHAEFELSLDKTSLSVSRRSRYIMKNPQTYLNYRICLAEMYQDKEMMGKFLNRTNDYNDVKVCAEEYKEFVRSLRSKFSSSYGSSDVIIPDTRDELFHKFKVYTIDESLERTIDILKRKEDIDVLVLFNLIQSTLVLTNAQMKNYRPFQTFCLYTRYSEEVLSQAFQTCRNRALVNRRRPVTKAHLNKRHSLPFLPMSYQLSQHYYRFFTWRFPSLVFNESFDLMTGLYEGDSSDRPNSFHFQKDPEGPGAEDEEAHTQGMLHFPMDAPGGASACCLTLMTLGLLTLDLSVPQQIVVVDSSLVDNEVVKSLTKALEEEEEEDERKRRPEVKPSQASHTNYLLMRGYYAPGILRSQNTHNSNSTDNIMVNACTVHLQLRRTPQHTLFTADADGVSALSPSTPPSLPLSFTRVYRSAAVDPQTFMDRCVSVSGYGAQDVQAVTEIRDAVEEGAEFGIDRQDLLERLIHLEQPEKGRSRTLQQYIQDLVDGEQLVEVGALSQRLVCAEASSHWLLNSVCDGVQMQQPFLKRGPAHDSAHATPPPTKRRAKESDFQETVAMERASTSTAVNQPVAMDPVSTTTAVNQPVAMDPVSTTTAVNQPVAMDPVSATTAVNHTVAMDPVSTSTAVNQLVAMDPVSTTTAVNQPVTMDPVSTTTAVNHTVAMDPVSTSTAVNHTVAMDPVSTSTAVNQPVAMDPVSTTTAVNHTVAMDPVSTSTAVNQPVAMDPVSTSTAVNQPVAMDPVSTSTAVNQPVAMDPVSTSTAVNQPVAMDPVSTSTTVNQPVTMETDSEQTDAVEEAAVRMTDVKGVGLNKDSAPSQIRDGAEGAADPDEHSWESVRFASRPWRVVDGSLNRPVCKGMLESLLLHVMSSPALRESVLLQHYSQVLQPVVVLDLLQVLIDLGCVRKRFTVQPPKPSLFSKPRVPQVKGHAEVSLRDAGTAFYEPTVDCILRLARVFPHELNWNKWVQLCLRA
ncbi:general transcription factor 3C polypeptide 1 isoform X3 [Siphateles boraxobius]|uniref:general transcription factor 3C polypeptide 1 isoform X3 n=1 Tax=Siphateles boraxobius TaxID=180520 RepID=UPI004062E90E